MNLQCGYTDGFICTHMGIFFVHICMNFLVDEFASATIDIHMNSEFICISVVTLANSSTNKFIHMCTNKCVIAMTCRRKIVLLLRVGILFAICFAYCYWVAMISRLLKIIGLSCKRALSKRKYSAQETYHFKKLTDRNHPIYYYIYLLLWSGYD